MPKQRDSDRVFRRSERITITIPALILEMLEKESARQGRSLSNLSAYLIETGLQKQEQK